MYQLAFLQAFYFSIITLLQIGKFAIGNFLIKTNEPLTVAYQKCYPKVNSQANPGWVMSGTLQFQPKIIAATFLIVRFLTFVSKWTNFLL